MKKHSTIKASGYFKQKEQDDTAPSSAALSPIWPPLKVHICPRLWSSVYGMNVIRRLNVALDWQNARYPAYKQ